MTLTLLLTGGGGVFKTQIEFEVSFDPLGLKIKYRYFLTFPKYAQRPY